MKKLRASDWLKTSAFSCNTSAKLLHMCKLLRAHAFKISSFSTFCAVFSCILTGNKMISLAIWCNRHLKSFQRLQIVLAHLLVQFCCLLLMLVNNKSCT